MATSAQVGQLAAELGISTEQATTDLAALEKVLKSVKEQLASVGITADTMGQRQEKAGASVRKFREEQRTSNFVVREAVQTVTSLSFAVAFLTQGNEKASETQKSMTQALLGGAAAANATEFAVFSLSRSFPALAAASGPLAIVIGLATAIFMFMEKARGETAKLRGEIDELRLSMGLLSKTEAIAKIEELAKKEAELENKLSEAQRKREALQKGQIAEAAKGVGEFGATDVGRAVSGTLTGSAGAIEAAGKSLDKISENENEILRINKEILLAGQERGKYQEVLNGLEKQERTLLDNSNKAMEEGAADIAKKAEAQGKYLARLADEEERLRERNAALFERESDATFKKLISDEQKRVDEAARAAEAKERGEIRAEEKLQLYKATGIRNQHDAEVADENYRYKRELDQLDKLAALHVDVDAQRKELDLAHARTIEDIERNTEARSLSAAENLASVLQSAFSRSGDTLVSKLMQALQVAIQIAQAVNRSSGDAAGIMGIISSIIPGLSLFADEGLVVPGQRGSPQLVVAHSGETILPTHRYGYAEAFNRVMASPQRFGSGGFVGSSQAGGAGQIVIRGKVDLTNGSIFFRQESRGYEKWKDKKLP